MQEVSEKKYQEGPENVDDSKKLLTVAQVAKMLQVGIRTVWRLDEKNKLPSPVKIGHRKRWRYEDLENWVAWDCPGRKKFNEMRNKRSGNGSVEK